MYRIIYFFSFISFLFLNTACEDLQKKNYDTKAIAEEMENREIKRVTENQLKEWVAQKGEICNNILTENLWKILLEQEDSLQINTFKELSKNDIPTIDSLEKTYKVEINKNTIEDSQKAIEEEVKVINYDTLLYTAPIYLPDKTLVGTWQLYFLRKEIIKMIEVD